MKGADSLLSGIISLIYHLQIKPTKNREEVTHWAAHMLAVDPTAPNRGNHNFLSSQLTGCLREEAGLGGSKEVKQEAAGHSRPRLGIGISAS